MKIHLALLRVVALLVPRERRADWFAEWTAELWYVSRSQRSATAFCLGALPDALGIALNAPTARSQFLHWESPLQCLLFLTVLGAASAFFAFHSSVARDFGLIYPDRDNANLVMISAHGPALKHGPSIGIAQFEKWAQASPGRFTDVAFCRPLVARVQLSNSRSADLSIARASSNLFDLLGTPLPQTSAPNKAQAGIILSHSAWRKYFARDPRVAGRRIEIDGQIAEIRGVVDETALRHMPVKVDAWLLEDPQDLATRAGDSKGYVFARLATATMDDQHTGLWHISLAGEDGSDRDFDCVYLAERFHNPLGVLLIFLVGTWLVVRAGSPLALGSLRQWAFLLAKTALLLPVVILGGFDLAHLITSIAPRVHPEFPILMTGWLLGMRWAMRDQQPRCPVCLRQLTNPVPIGQASQTLLGWYGTELFCTKGHGLLHIPELRASSCSEAHWVRLDPSWSSLFS